MQNTKLSRGLIVCLGCRTFKQTETPKINTVTLNEQMYNLWQHIQYILQTHTQTSGPSLYGLACLSTRINPLIKQNWSRKTNQNVKFTKKALHNKSLFNQKHINQIHPHHKCMNLQYCRSHKNHFEFLIFASEPLESLSRPAIYVLASLCPERTCVICWSETCSCWHKPMAWLKQAARRCLHCRTHNTTCQTHFQNRDYTVRREALWSNGNKTALFHYSLKGIEESSRTFDTDIYHVPTASTSI